MTDRTVNLALYTTLPSRKLTNADGSPTTLSPVTEGDTLLCTVRVLDFVGDTDTPTQIDLPVRSLNASVGKTVAPPTAGTFKLRGEVVTPGSPTHPASPAAFSATNLGAIIEVYVTDADGNNIGSTGDVSTQDPGTVASNLTGSLGSNIASAGYDPEGHNLSVTAGNTTVSLHLRYTSLGDIDNTEQRIDSNPIPVGPNGPDIHTPTDSAAIAFNADPDTFAAALAPICASAPVEVSSPATCVWLFRLTNSAPFPMEVGANNRLDPASFVRVRQFERFAGETWCEVRLIQSPLAWNLDGYDHVLPPPPSVREIRRGFAGSEAEGLTPLNEIQAVTIPADFRGTYYLRWNNLSTTVLGIQDGPNEIATALNALFEDGNIRFAVTNPEAENAFVEFVGPLKAAPQNLIEAIVDEFPPGVLTFNVPLDRAEMRGALRTVEFIDAPFEVQIELGDTDAPETPGRIYTLFSTTLRVMREQIYAELETVSSLNWQHPYSAKDYIPFTRDQIIIGNQNYIGTFPSLSGLGTRTFDFPHNFHTFAFTYAVRENSSGGRPLVLGTDYTLGFPTDDRATLTLTGYATPSSVGQLAILLTAAGPTAAFQAHTHTMEQIIGLLDALSDLKARVTALESLVPTSTLAARVASDLDKVQLKQRVLFFPGRMPDGFTAAAAASALQAGDLTSLNLPRPPNLLPAIHDATFGDAHALPSILPAASTDSYQGKIWKNKTGAQYLIPGAQGRPNGYLPADGYAATDGRVWYRVNRAGTTNSFFPADFEKDLFVFQMTPEMWQPGASVDLSFSIDLLTYEANSGAQIVLILEAGSDPSQADPSPTAPNLENVVWSDTPIIAQRIILSEVQVTHKFGASISLATDGTTIHADRLLYTAWTVAPAGSAPTSRGFALRGRLGYFDTENNVKGAVGFVVANFHDGLVAISS